MKCTGKHCEAKDCPYRTDTVLGYNADLLIPFAQACHEQGITNEDLKDFASNIYYAYKVVYESIQKDWNEAINRYIHE